MKKIISRVLIFVCIIAIWQTVFYAGIFPKILFPSAFDILKTFFNEIRDGSMFLKLGYTLYLIALGLFFSFLIVIIFVLIASVSKSSKNFFLTAVSVLDPLPSIALLPLAILWFGIGKTSIVVVMAHSVIWPVLLAILTGFDAIPKIYKEVAANMQISRIRAIFDIYIPASMPSILMGIKNGWARAWRALIAAEMVFGTTGATGGIGWDIYIKRSYLDMTGMLSSILLLMIVGILVEDLFFKFIEKKTIKKWGMVA